VLYLSYGERRRHEYLYSLTAKEKKDLADRFKQSTANIEKLEVLITQGLVNNEILSQTTPLFDMVDTEDTVYSIGKYYDYDAKKLVKIGHGNVTYMDGNARKNVPFNHLILTNIYSPRYYKVFTVDGSAYDNDGYYYKNFGDIALHIRVNEKSEVKVKVTSDSPSIPFSENLLSNILNQYNDVNDTALHVVEMKENPTVTMALPSVPETRAKIERLEGSQSLLYWIMYIEFMFLN
jgi:hypothetical protein